MSQTLYVPISAVFITVYKGGWKWKAGYSLYFYLIEKWFLKLGLYKVNWWKTYYTPIFLMVNFFLNDGVYRLLKDKKKWALANSQYLSLMVTGISLLYCTAAGRQLRFGFSRYHSWKEHFMIAPLYSMVLSFVGVLLSFKEHVIYRVVFLSSCILFDLLLIKTGILKMKITQIAGNIPFHIFMIFMSRFLHNSIYKWGAD
ncbi:hypothetical protein D3H55_04425 [Bacillus salacetis]|uniref:Uncharacterized protein n=1 Tax=Bacillus salacetis TaxID=2315464 RepID=A0A3A1R6Z9_9BACI|nr:hypothetical protein D3H55_04425 [Bacillus salacetis]